MIHNVDYLDYAISC